jgi:hypothetical protein
MTLCGRRITNGCVLQTTTLGALVEQQTGSAI